MPLDGFIGPAHVSTVIGSQPYEYFAEEYQRPVVIAGFEPLDVMQAILMLVRQLNDGRAEVENEFTRAVTREGNAQGQGAGGRGVRTAAHFRMARPGRGARTARCGSRRNTARFDAEARYGIAYKSVPDNKACECGAILRGVKKPTDCKVFGTVCTPENPIGSCMVSSEGACAAHYTYGRFRDVAVVAARPRSDRRPSHDGGAQRLRPARGLQARARRHDPRRRRPRDGAADRRAVRRARSTTSGCARPTTRPRFAVGAGRMVIATDSHVVSPLFFPGGDIGCLSVHGTINDVAMAGAAPLYLAAGFILEEGFPLADLQRIVESMAAAAREAGVPVVTGDTKVVERGKGDGVFITTTGVGVVPAGVDISGDRARPGRRDPRQRNDRRPRRGDHVAAREPRRSRRRSGPTRRRCTASSRRWSRRCPASTACAIPTRGGLATTLNELARQSGCGMVIAEKRDSGARARSRGVRIPRPRSALRRQRGQAGRDLRGATTRSACSRRCARIRWARDAAIIGEVIEDPHHFVQMDTRFGGRRIVDWLTGEQLPRIC